MKWRDYFGNTNSNYKPPIFPKKDKTNLPKEKPSKHLEVFLSACKSDLLGSIKQNQRKVGPNLSLEEREALTDLIQLQRYKIITIEPCEKGAEIIICDFNDYILAMII